MTRPDFTALIAAFAWMVRGLSTQVAARGAGVNPLPTPIVLASFALLARSLLRFTNCIARFLAGRPAARKRAAIGEPKPRTPRASTRPALPQRQGWLVPMIPMHAAHAGNQLRHLLAEPEMAQLIAGAPGIGRVLRPLARMLGVDLPASLQLPKRRAAAPVPRRPAPPKPRPWPASFAAWKARRPPPSAPKAKSR